MIAATASILAASMLAQPAHSGPARAAGPPTVVTSDRLEVDYAKNVADFTGRVHVKDRSGDLFADRMIVIFNPADRQVREITATGRQVVIDSPGRRAVSRKAVYTANDGRILLTGDPKILHGPNAYAAERITIFKDQDRTIFEPRARMVFYSDQGPGFANDARGLPAAPAPPRGAGGGPAPGAFRKALP